MSDSLIITSPDDPRLDELCGQLSERAKELDHTNEWPAEQLRLCGRYGVYQWFVPKEWGGQAWNDVDVVRGYLRLSAACLTTTFIITQRTGACRRILVSDNQAVQDELLPGLVRGDSFATVGISHLTTSRRHLARPVLRAAQTEGGFILDGFSPWVTGSPHAETVVLGATLDDGREILMALPTDLPGVTTPEPPLLVGLSASQTGEVRLAEVHVADDRLLAGPVENVMSGGAGAKSGGLQTSALAIGLTHAALEYLQDEAQKRQDLVEPVDRLRAEHEALESDLLAMTGGEQVCSNEELRQRANSLVLRASQAALSAAKGTGYVLGHPAGRWCREALFFLVWSCPQPVAQAHLCELAGISQ